MVNIGFWNVNSLRDLETDVRQMPRWIAELTLERSLDILFLIECRIGYDLLLPPLQEGTGYYPVACGDRFKVLARFDPQLIEKLSPPISSDRYDIWHLKLPLQHDILMVAVHGFDKRNNSSDKQALLFQQVVETISYFEELIGHTRSVVLGDFNANPFEPPIAGALGMHAVQSRETALNRPRQMLDKGYDYFYNPMWNLFGDEPSGSAPATYHYLGSDPYELYWHMLDQVLIRPSLIDAFDFSSLEIVTKINGTRLTKSRGVPDQKHFSDHLPVVFSLNLVDDTEKRS